MHRIVKSMYYHAIDTFYFDQKEINVTTRESVFEHFQEDNLKCDCSGSFA